MSQSATIIITPARAIRIPADWYWELGAGDGGSSVFLRYGVTGNMHAVKVAAPVESPEDFIEDLVTTAVFVGANMVLNARALQAVAGDQVDESDRPEEPTE